jgi:CRP-like cAMP-binding protein
MDTATYSAERRPLLWDAPVAFVLSSLEEAKVRIAKRRYEAGETIYSRGEPDRYLYFLTEGVLKIYKSYGGTQGGHRGAARGGQRLRCA